MSEHSPFLTNGTDSVTMSDSSGKTDRYRYHLTYHVKLHTGASQKQKITGDVKTLFILIHPLRIAHVVGKISRAKFFCQSTYNFIRIHLVSIVHIVKKISSTKILSNSTSTGLMQVKSHHHHHHPQLRSSHYHNYHYVSHHLIIR